MKEATGRASRFVYVSSIAAMGMGRHLKGVKETDPTRKVRRSTITMRKPTQKRWCEPAMTRGKSPVSLYGPRT